MLSNFSSLQHSDNGTYLCHGENKYGTAMSVPILMVMDKPEVKLDAVVPVGMDKLFFNWTVTNWNSPVTDYYLSVSIIYVLGTTFDLHLLKTTHCIMKNFKH
jgi:hypothetical protein